MRLPVRRTEEQAGFHTARADTIEYGVPEQHSRCPAVTTKPREIKIVQDDTAEVGCDGGGGSGALGHPLIYLRFEQRRHVDCYYCGQRFAKSGYESPEAHTSA